MDNYDWRLMGQEEYLMNQNLMFTNYEPYSEIWNHEHCEFCTARFSEYNGDLHKGYCTLDKQRWSCEDCFNDFHEKFNWTVVSEEEIT